MIENVPAQKFAHCDRCEQQSRVPSGLCLPQQWSTVHVRGHADEDRGKYDLCFACVVDLDVMLASAPTKENQS